MLQIEIELIENGVVTLSDAFYLVEDLVDQTGVTAEDIILHHHLLPFLLLRLIRFVDFFVDCVFEAVRWGLSLRRNCGYHGDIFEVVDKVVV